MMLLSSRLSFFMGWLRLEQDRILWQSVFSRLLAASYVLFVLNNNKKNKLMRQRLKTALSTRNQRSIDREKKENEKSCCQKSFLDCVENVCFNQHLGKLKNENIGAITKNINFGEYTRTSTFNALSRDLRLTIF